MTRYGRQDGPMEVCVSSGSTLDDLNAHLHGVIAFEWHVTPISLRSAAVYVSYA